MGILEQKKRFFFKEAKEHMLKKSFNLKFTITKVAIYAKN